MVRPFKKIGSNNIGICIPGGALLQCKNAGHTNIIMCFCKVMLLELVYILDTNIIYCLDSCKAILNHQLCYSGFAGVLDCKFHPRQPWLFTAGADSMIRLYCD
jgi:hypothetical protein